MPSISSRPTELDLVDRAEAWDAIAAIAGRTLAQGSDGLAGLPPPAVRLLSRAVPASVAADGRTVISAVVLDMEGEIKLKRWLPFTARQILHPTGGFVWNATVGGRLLRLTGGDSYHRGRGSLEFRLAGLLPVVRAAGPDVDRSAAGRFAIETVAWAPHALLPAAGARWRPIDDGRAVVAREVDGEQMEVTVTVDDDGVLRQLETMRWGDPDGAVFGLHPFGGSVSEVATFAGTTLASAGVVGWGDEHDRRHDGAFFRFRILDANVVGIADR